ncbi:MAG: tetratricopeptide repeat protein [Chthoniobacterales bacterium]
MANRNKDTKRVVRQPGFPIPLLLLVAFALGAGMVWLVMRESAPEAPKVAIQNFVPPTSGQAPAAPQVAQAAIAGPPDVSQLTPAEAARALANWNYDRQDWSHAIEHYQVAIARGADNPDVRTDLGNCFRFLGQPEKALEQYQLAQKQDPRHENSLFNQISLFSQYLHDNARAEATTRDFLQRFPLSPQAATAKQLLSKSEGVTGSNSSPK